MNYDHILCEQRSGHSLALLRFAAMGIMFYENQTFVKGPPERRQHVEVTKTEILNNVLI